MATGKKSKSKWTIDKLLVEDMLNVFHNETCRLDALKLSRQSWQKIIDRQGVRQTTSLNAVKIFFGILASVTEGSHDHAGLHERIAKDIFKKYESRISNHNYLQFIEAV